MDFLRLEFHCHSSASKDSLLSPRRLVQAARQSGLQRVVLTDHNTIGGALEAQRLDPGLLIVGEEIMTTQGELLAAFVKEGIPSGLEPEECIRRLRAQGAFISVSHPFDTFRSGHWDEADLLRILPLVDAIETFNARCMDMRPNLQAQEFARRHNLPGTVGSDAHTARELGRASLALPPFEDADGLRQALPAARVDCRLSSPLIHLSSRFAVTVKKLGLTGKPRK